MAGKDQQFWTKQNIKASIQALHAQAIPLHTYKLMRDRSEETSQILFKIVGRKTTGSGLCIICKKKFGSLDRAYKAAGFKPCELRGDTSTWTKKQLKDAIVALNDHNVPLNVGKIEKDRSSRSTEIIFKATGLKIYPRKLYRTSIRKFGSWDNALKKSGLSVSQIKINHQGWDKRNILACIRKIHKNGIELNLRNIENDKRRRVSNLIAPDDRKISYAIKLIFNAKKEFGSWDKALDAAGLDSTKINKRPKFWTRKMMIDSIVALDNANTLINTNSIQFDTSRKTSKIISEIVGKKTTGAQLYGAINNHYGSWAQVVQTVRKNPEKVGSNVSFWTKRSVVRSIRELHRSKIALNPSSIRCDRRIETKEILKNTYEGTVSGPILYSAATQLFSSWEEALIGASLNPADIRKKGISVSRSKQDLKDLISFLYETGFKLNASNVCSGSRNIKYLTCNKFREVISGFSILNEARRTIGDWENTLRRAGLNPLEIVLRSRYRWSLSTTPHQIERVQDKDGSLRKVAFLGVPIKTPEELVEEQRVSENLLSTLRQEVPCAEETYHELLDAISMIDTFDSQQDFAQKVSVFTNGKFNASAVLHLLSALGTSNFQYT